ncbi:DUF4367 domain-containing protein [Sedimentibacter sp.]|uniref:DUF4367 domain-containing protein n=1 Tax=Sedimentibacter sp. TaxID=1960295 RepID=UPI000ECAD1E7|nr:DUF4367 domain-containing protein [Sedimentibacter sp.]HCX63131.1 hypothetical protein [Clostridiales bacterium]
MANEILKNALIISMENELNTIPSSVDLKEYHSFSDEFDKRMKTLIKKANIKYVNIDKFRVRRSIVAASLIIIIATASMSVEALRLPIIKLTEKIYTEFSEILFDNEENIAVPEMIEDVYVPSYMTEGYTLIEESKDMKLMHFLVYANEKDQLIMVDQFTLGVSMAVDTEGITTEEITIKDKSGIIYSKNGLTTIIINDNNYVHMISGYESREEIIKIAESLHIRE